MNNTHQFTFYVPTLSHEMSEHKNVLIISDDSFVNRIKNILRLEKGERCMLFDRHIQVLVEVGEITKKTVQLLVQWQKDNQSCAPSITFLLPLLKKESFEQALYSLAEMGVNDIQLLITAKTHRSWTEKEKERAERILIAAAEQSKNFMFPRIHNPVMLDSHLVSLKKGTLKLFFDPAGTPLSQMLPSLPPSSEIILFIGPEGDLTEAEKAAVKSAGFQFCALTPTILRSCQAVALGSGIIRSWFLQK